MSASNTAPHQLSSDKPECPTRLVADAPAPTDAFGGHDPVARAMFQLFETEAGGRIVGLLGDWGSGKSTVVELLRQRSTSSPYTSVFVFDAWAHQGDSLRRAFLEKLVSFLVGQGWLAEGAFKNDLEALAGRRERVETTSEPRLTWKAWLALAGIAAVPIGLALFAKYGFEDGGIVGLVLACFPILALLVAALRTRTGGGLDQAAALFIERRSSETVTTTVRTGSPTSVEFASFFSNVVERSLADKRRRLVVVLDNLDRIERRDAISVWATMRTFPEALSASESDRLWIVVPIDEDAAISLWQPDTSSLGEGPPNSFVPGDQFLSKTFQAVFTVPQPVLSDWKSYLMELLAEALPNHKPAEFEPVFWVVQRHTYSGSTPITPRRLKNIVNRIGSLHRTRGDEFPLGTLALYVALSEKRSDLAGALGDPAGVPPALVAASDVDADIWPQALASLDLGVEQGKALQLLLETRLEQAFASGDTGSIQGWSTVPGFGDVCVGLLQRKAPEWAQTSPDLLFDTARTLGASALDSPWLPTVWELLARFGASGSAKQVRIDDGWGSAISVIASNCSPARREAVLRFAASALEEAPLRADEDGEGLPVTEWAAGAIPVLRAALEDSTQLTISVPGGPEAFLRLVDALANEGIEDEIRSRLKPTKPGSVIAELTRRFQAGDPHDELQGLAAALPTFATEWNTKSGVDPILEQLRAESAGASADALTRLRWLLALRPLDSESWQEGMEAFVMGGHCLHRLYQSEAEGVPELSVLCIALQVRIRPAGDVVDVGNSATGRQIFTETKANPTRRPDVLARLIQEIWAFVTPEELVERVASSSDLAPLATNLIAGYWRGKLGTLQADLVMSNLEWLEANDHSLVAD